MPYGGRWTLEQPDPRSQQRCPGRPLASWQVSPEEDHATLSRAEERNRAEGRRSSETAGWTREELEALDRRDERWETDERTIFVGHSMYDGCE